VRTSPKEQRNLVRRAQRHLRRSGVTARVRAVTDALRSPGFAERFAAERAFVEALAPLPGLAAVRDLSLRVLGAMGVDARDVLLQFSWDPAAKKLGIDAKATPSAAAEAVEKARAPRAHQGRTAP
jgi:hypothetical protein